MHVEAPLLEKISKGTRKDSESDLIDVKGSDGGDMGRLKRIIFQPNSEFFSLMENDRNRVVDDFLKKSLYAYCEKIGWWPDENRKAYEIHKQDDGTYLLISYLKKSLGRSKSKSELTDGIISINND